MLLSHGIALAIIIEIMVVTTIIPLLVNKGLTTNFMCNILIGVKTYISALRMVSFITLFQIFSPVSSFTTQIVSLIEFFLIKNLMV